MNGTLESSAKPFLKWAGGKHRLVERISSALPPGRRLLEPFAGSASVFLGTNYGSYVVADVNKDLIDVFSAAKSATAELLSELQALFVPENNVEEAFYDLRAEFNERDASVRKSAIFVYLNRHCFNGLCRYNKAGKFNVPFGRYARPIAPVEEILRFSRKAKSATFLACDFRRIFEMAERGDVIYCDPPYVPLSATANFTSYSAGDFGPELQRELASVARSAAARGIPVVISNHDTPWTRDLYAGAEVSSFGVQRFISRDTANRAVAPELLAVFSE